MATEGTEKSVARRSFIDLLGKIFLSLWGFGFIGVIYAYLGAPKRERERGGSLDAGPLNRIPVGEASLVQHPSGPLLVVRLTENEVMAFAGLCTHVRCVVRWDRASRTIMCPCHGGAFDTSGNVLYGPPPRPLPRYEAEIRDNEILVRLG